MKRQGLAMLGYLLFSLPSTHYAYDLSESLQINGFGTFGVSTNDSDEIQYRTNSEQEGSVARGEFNFGINTIAGLQARYRFTDTLSLTAQGVVRYQDHNVWESDLDWAYLTYDTPWNISIRAGKFRFPIFQSSELAYVGYSRTYVRPPLIFYGVGGHDHVSGAQVTYNTSWQNLDLSLQATYGHSKNELPRIADGTYHEVESDNIKIVSAKVDNDRFWLNLSYTHLTSDLTTFRVGRPPNRRGLTDLSMWSAEWQFQLAEFILEGGYGRGLIDKFMADEEVFYSSLSYPIADFTPYVLYSSKQFSDIPPPPNPNVNPPDESDFFDQIYSLGFRYDFQPGLALKFQLDHIKASKDAGLSSNLQRKRDSHNACSLVLDWMF